MSWDPSVTLSELPPTQKALIKEHLSRASKLCDKLRLQFPSLGHDLIDNAALCGMVAAARRFKPGPTAKYWPFAVSHIYGSTRSACRRQQRMQLEEWSEHHAPSNQNRPDVLVTIREASAPLSASERDLLGKLLVAGYTPTEMAKSRSVTVSCISHQKRAILRKMRGVLGIRNGNTQHRSTRACNDATQTKDDTAAQLPTTVEPDVEPRTEDIVELYRLLCALIVVLACTSSSASRSISITPPSTWIAGYQPVEYRHVHQGFAPHPRPWLLCHVRYGRGPPPQLPRRPPGRTGAHADQTSQRP